MTTEDLINLKTIHAFLEPTSDLAKSLGKVIGNDFEAELNELEYRVLVELSAQVDLNVGMTFATLEEIEANELPDLLEYRNEITGNVFDFHPISILKGGQIEGLTIEGEPIKGDPVSIKQLPLDSKIALLRLIKETK